MNKRRNERCILNIEGFHISRRNDYISVFIVIIRPKVSKIGAELIFKTF